MEGPGDLALDSAGNIFVIDSASKTIRKFSSDGQGGGEWARSQISEYDYISFANTIAIGPGLSHAVSGRVIDGTTRVPLPNVTITVVSHTVSSGPDGEFMVGGVDREGPVTVEVSAPGYAPQSVVAEIKGKDLAVDLGDVALYPDDFRVESIEFDPDIVALLQGWNYELTAKARVNWDENTPVKVEFYANDKLVATKVGTGPEYEATFLVDEDFVASLQPDGNKIKVVATGRDAQQQNRTSQPLEKGAWVLPLPGYLKLYASAASKLSLSNKVEMKFKFPTSVPQEGISLPVLGRIEGKTEVELEFKFDFTTGAFELVAGASNDATSGFKLKFGDMEASSKIKGSLKGVASSGTGIDLTSGEISAGLEVKGEYKIGSFTPLVLLGPISSVIKRYLPKASDKLNAIMINVYFKPGLTGNLAVGVKSTSGVRELDFKTLELKGKAALEAKYEPKIAEKLKLELYVGGEGSATFAMPRPFFRKFEFKAYAGLEYTIWHLKNENKYVFLDYTYDAASSPPSFFESLAAEGSMLAGIENMGESWQPIDRPWRQLGSEVFMPSLMVNEAAASAALEAPAPVQSSFPLLQNVFPNSEPSIAASGNHLMLVYVRDNGAESETHFTEIAFSHFDGTSWSIPQAVAPDSRGQFQPQVAYDGAGNAVVVFERIKSAAFSGTEIPAMAAQMELVWCRWDAGTQTWSAAQPLTDNAYLDFKPQLAGPLTNGDVLLTWTQNEANEVEGMGAVGDLTNARVMTARWKSVEQSWTTPEVLVPNLTGELSQDLSAGGTKGTYVWTVDADGDATDVSDSDLFYRTFSSTTQAWGPTGQATQDAVKDTDARVVVNSAGEAVVLWNKNGDLVMQKDFAGTPSLVKADASNLGLADITLTAAPQGHLAMIWQEEREGGSNAYYRVFDSLSGTWGQDALLTHDDGLERSFAPAWDAGGALVVAYNQVEIVKQNVEVPVEGGGIVTVENVPQPGRVDLLLTRRTLGFDLSIPADGLASSNRRAMPGDTITLTGRVKNTGDLAIENVTVDFYDGDPNAGGRYLESVTLPGWLEAAGEREVSFVWTVPSPASVHAIHMIAYPGSYVEETDASNNSAFIELNGVDLAVEVQSATADRNGGARVGIKVTNLSAPHSVPAPLVLKSYPAGTVIAQAEVPELAAGYALTIPLRVSAGTLAEGSSQFEVIVDESGLNDDIDRDNNSALMALDLMIDDDKDGLPRAWEVANGMSDSFAGDAVSDVDHDGFNALMEYKAGTSPRDSSSRLVIGSFVPAPVEPDGTRGVTVTWPSQSGRLYRVESSVDLMTWQTVASDVEATPPTNTLQDQVASGTAKVFYRVVAH